MGKRVVEERVQINQNTSGVVQTVGVANVATEIASYTVPDNSQLILNPTDFIAMYLHSATGPAELAANTPVQVLVKDPLSRRTRVIAEGEYVQFKEFQSSLLKYYVGTRVVIPANFIWALKVNGVLAAATATTRFTFSCTNVYETLD